MLKHLYVEIDATEAKRQQLAPVVKAAARDLIPLHGQLHDARRQAIALLSQPTIDRGALETLRAEQLRLIEQATGQAVYSGEEAEEDAETDAETAEAELTMAAA